MARDMAQYKVMVCVVDKVMYLMCSKIVTFQKCFLGGKISMLNFLVSKSVKP